MSIDEQTNLVTHATFIYYDGDWTLYCKIQIFTELNPNFLHMFLMLACSLWLGYFLAAIFFLWIV
jgi:hypothetical protein